MRWIWIALLLGSACATAPARIRNPSSFIEVSTQGDEPAVLEAIAQVAKELGLEKSAAVGGAEQNPICRKYRIEGCYVGKFSIPDDPWGARYIQVSLVVMAYQERHLVVVVRLVFESQERGEPREAYESRLREGFVSELGKRLGQSRVRDVR